MAWHMGLTLQPVLGDADEGVHFGQQVHRVGLGADVGCHLDGAAHCPELGSSSHSNPAANYVVLAHAEAIGVEWLDSVIGCVGKADFLVDCADENVVGVLDTEQEKRIGASTILCKHNKGKEGKGEELHFAKWRFGCGPCRVNAHTFPHRTGNLRSKTKKRRMPGFTFLFLFLCCTHARQMAMPPLWAEPTPANLLLRSKTVPSTFVYALYPGICIDIVDHWTHRIIAGPVCDEVRRRRMAPCMHGHGSTHAAPPKRWSAGGLINPRHVRWWCNNGSSHLIMCIPLCAYFPPSTSICVSHQTPPKVSKAPCYPTPGYIKLSQCPHAALSHCPHTRHQAVTMPPHPTLRCHTAPTPGIRLSQCPHTRLLNCHNAPTPGYYATTLPPR